MSNRRRSIHAFIGASLVAVLATATLQGLSQGAGAQPAGATPDDGSHWTTTSARPLESKDGHTRRVNPRGFAGYRLDRDSLVDRLSRAPVEGTRAAPLVVAVPAPNGKLVDFAVTESPVMESGLAADNPEISTFAGRAVQDPTATIRLDVTPMGFHASVRGSGEQGAWHVDPAYNGDDSLYLSYLGSALPVPEQGLVEPELDQSTVDEVTQDENAGEAPGAEVSLRTYRLALVTDPSYAAYFGTENVLAEKVTLMNRVNHVYNDDLAIRMTLINQTDLLNLDTAAEATEPNGPCGAAACFTTQNLSSCTGTALNRNRVVLGQLIGASNYDIGHLALGNPGGGVAQLNAVGGDGKARGCTGLPTPEGDFFAVDYVAHEMGHQFGGPHTFNGTQLNCAGNRGGSPYEPGSGSSVMAYAGICRQDDLQPHSDPYFSQRSITDLTNYVVSARAPINEVQTVSLRNFDGTDSFTLSYNGQPTQPIVRGTNYSAVGIDAALEAVTGPDTVVVQPWIGLTNPPSPFDDTGFQVLFGGTLAATDLSSLTVTTGTGDVTGFVGETARGGAIDNGGRTVTPSGNFAPIATAPAARTIPVQTPFALTGTGTDPDGDPLVYIWEQNDRGGAAGVRLGSQVKPDGALFRIFGQYAPVTPAGTLQIESPGENLATSNPTRVFPDLAQILANNTNAITGTCPEMPPPPTSGPSNVPIPTRECFAEWLPTAGYLGSPLGPNAEPSLNFRFTARDLDPAAGGYAFGDVKLTLDRTAGPFLVTSQRTATPAPVTGGAITPVTWTVNGTQRLAPNVRITLSTDGGATFGTVLAASTPNDGVHELTMPNITSNQARIKIEAVDNYFFDINDANFTILADPNAPDTTITSGPKRNGFELDRKVRFRYSSNEPGSSFACARNGKPGSSCGVSRATVRVKPGTHTFSVAAVDASGNEDPTPAMRTWARPFDDRPLARTDFKKLKAKNAYRGTYVQAKREGATLVRRLKNAKKVALVVGTGKGFGRVEVLLGKKKLRTVDLASKKTEFGVLVKVKTFKRPTSGKLTIRATSDKVVRIDGLGELRRRR